MAVAAVVGSAFPDAGLLGSPLEAVEVPTAAGVVQLHAAGPDRWVLFRHGAPHRFLPHQVPWRAQALAMQAVGVDTLLLTSSVGLLDASLPLFQPMLLGDLLMPDNRLPDGAACTVWPEPAPGQGHLVVEEGLFHPGLSAQVAGWLPAGSPTGLVFAYVPGPRTKTPAENRYWRAAGAQVNSMSVGPEVVMANELGIAVAGLVVGHKRSGGAAASTPATTTLWEEAISASLVASRLAVERLVLRFLREAQPVPAANRLHRL
jgi:5'-methylthioadenosine phosphorylase